MDSDILMSNLKKTKKTKSNDRNELTEQQISKAISEYNLFYQSHLKFDYVFNLGSEGVHCFRLGNLAVSIVLFLLLLTLLKLAAYLKYPKSGKTFLV